MAKHSGTAEASADDSVIRRSVLLSGVHVPTFVGTDEHLLRDLENHHPAVKFHLRDHLLTLTGPASAVSAAERVVHEALDIARTTGAPTSRDVHALSTSSSGVAGQNAPTDLVSKSLAKPILTVRGRAIRPQTAGQRAYVEAMRDHTITFGVGPAGTGKTYLAIACAVSALQAREVSKIVLTRPAVEAGERLGYLPGRLEDKIDPYLRPLFDAIANMVDADAVPRMLESGTIEVAPLAYMRGRTLNESFVILDEAQNTTSEQLKMFLTRLGYDTRMVITGDPSQIDLPGKGSGLQHAMRVLEGVDDIAQAKLSPDDIVRNSLVTRIVDAYDAYPQAHTSSVNSHHPKRQS